MLQAVVITPGAWGRDQSLSCGGNVSLGRLRRFTAALERKVWARGPRRKMRCEATVQPAEEISVENKHLPSDSHWELSNIGNPWEFDSTL